MSYFEVAPVRLNKDPPAEYPECIGGADTQSPTNWSCSQATFGGLFRDGISMAARDRPTEDKLSLTEVERS
jgi:hypothetical protein